MPASSVSGQGFARDSAGGKAGLLETAFALLFAACSAAGSGELEASWMVEPALDAVEPLPPLGQLLAENQKRVDQIIEQAHRASSSADAPAALGTGFASAGSLDGSVELGARVLLSDGDAELWIREPRAEVAAPLGKAKVLGEALALEGYGEPAVYARVTREGWLFQRPDLELNVIVISDAAPAFVFDDFVTAAATIAGASRRDCLDAGFMTVMRRSTYDGLPAAGRAVLRAKTVVYAPGACQRGYAACAQFPVQDSVVVARADGTTQLERRFVSGPRIGVDSDQIQASSSASRATFVHELMHSLGVAHPKQELASSGRNALKHVVPGTLAGSCASAPCEPGTNYPSIMHQSVDEGRTEWLASDDIDVLATLYASEDGCTYSSSPRLVEAR